MSKKIFISLLIGILLLNFQIVFAQNSKSKLSEVKKIYIQQIEDEKYKKFYENLTVELRRKLVFTVVPTVEEADAVLEIKFMVEITLHGDKDDWDKPIFSCNLLTIKKESIWKKVIKINAQGNFDEKNQLAVQKIADKLVEDWLISERKRKK